MKNIPVLKVTATIFGLLLLAGQGVALAATVTSDVPVTKILNGTKHEVNYYNAFGVCYSSTQTSRTTTETTQGDETSTVVSESTTTSKWCDGSLKTETITGTTTTTDSAGTVTSTSNSTITYTYDEQGHLQGASGTTTTNGTLPDDGGTYTATTVDTYSIQYGQALRTQSATSQTTTVDGQTQQTSTNTTTYGYELIGGQMRLMTESSVLSATATDGSTSNITTAKTYTRDANGVCTGVSQTKTGTQTAKDSNGGTWTSSISSYNGTFTFDENLGWYLSAEETDWTDYVAE
jgi:hypothetical protein